MYETTRIAILALIMLTAFGCSQSESDSQKKEQIATNQEAFCEVISSYKEKYLTEKKKNFYIDQESTLENIYTQRTETLKKILKDGVVKNWNGKISDIVLSKDKGAFLEVSLSCGVTLEPQDSLLIPIDSKLYQDLRKFSEKSKITFSGNFLTPPDTESQGKYPYEIFYGEKSFTKEGCIEAPEFLFRFTEIK